MPFVATWMDLEIVILSEVRKRQTLYDITYVESKKIIEMNLFTKQKQIYRQKDIFVFFKPVVTKGGKGINLEYGINRYTVLYIKQGPT